MTLILKPATIISKHVTASVPFLNRRFYTMDFNSSANKIILSEGRPPFIYGTAWKKDKTTTLVKQALNAGFRAIDTAAQPRHYQEPLVGEALREVLREGKITREQLYVCLRHSISDDLILDRPEHNGSYGLRHASPADISSRSKRNSPHPEAKT
jgi:aryl-alcohol dehydrogenase-like predicted oxidoreductase